MFLTAPLIHDGRRFLPAGSVIEVSENGVVEAVTSLGVQEHVRHYDGILCPGFVNAHCHLELSHLEGVLPERTGLIPFLQQIPFIRMKFSEEEKQEARERAYGRMLSNGIVAVGDIANTTDTIALREKDRMHIHSFIEAIGFTEEVAGTAFESMKAVYNAFSGAGRGEKLRRQSIVPHAPYSVSRQLFGLIDNHHSGALISIHNQESAEENSYYRSKEGKVQELLATFNIDDSYFKPFGKSSLQTYMHWLSPSHPLIMVHNTASDPEDITAAMQRFPQLFWCLCPNANLYIEDRLPDVTTLLQAGAHICIGTDSLASNHQLSVLSELRTLKQHFPALEWETLLRWGTYNGAKALQMDDMVGSITPGMQPGILHVRPEEGVVEVVQA